MAVMKYKDPVTGQVKKVGGGGVPSAHTHSASDIDSGVLPVARGGTGVSTLDALATAMGSCKIQYNSYTGTGTHGASNKNSLTFNFTPKAVLVVCDDGYQAVFVHSATKTLCNAPNLTTPFGINVSWSGNKLEWYVTDNYPDHQLNKKDDKYYYIAVG